jgi:hypothetical protein
MDVFKLDVTDVGQLQFSYSLPVIKLSLYRPKVLDGLYWVSDKPFPISNYFTKFDMGGFHYSCLHSRYLAMMINNKS